MSNDDVVISAQCDRSGWFTSPVSAWNRMGLTGQRFKVVIAPLPMTRDDLRDLVPALWTRMAQDCEVKWSLPTPPGTAQVPQADASEAQWLDRETLSEQLGISRSTFYRKLQAGQIETRDTAGRLLYRPRVGVYCKGDADAGQSYQAGAAAKLGHVIEAAQSLHAKLDAPGHQVHRLQAELDDLRAKHERAWRELRYRRAIAPCGMRFVEEFLSGDAYRRTPDIHDFCSYLNGVKAYHVLESHSGPTGFVVICEGGNTTAREMTSGMVHILKRDASDKTPFPKELEFFR